MRRRAKLPVVRTPAEKKERIEQLRLINGIARKHLDPKFCDEVAATLLLAEDVPTEETQ